MPVAHMAPDLELVFRELGLAQYLDSFVEQGFESWDTILDIQESDLYVVHNSLASSPTFY